MSELYGDVLQFLLYAFEGYCLCRLCGGFLISKIGKTRWSKTVPGILWVVFRYISSLTPSDNNGMVLAGKFLLCQIGICCVSLAWYQGKRLWKFYVVMLFLALRELSFFAGYSLIGIGTGIVEVLAYGFGKGWMQEDAFLTAVFGAANFALLCMSTAEGILLYLGVGFILKHVSRDCQRRNGKELLISMLPAVAGLLIGLMLRLMMFLMEEGNWVILYQKYPILYIIVPIISMILFTSILFNSWLYQIVSQQNEKQKEQQLLQNQITQMQSAMQEMERLYDGIRGVRHDMKNQMLALQGILLEQGEEFPEVGEFISDMYRSVEQLDYGLHTGNSVCDVVIGSKFAYAKKLKPICLNADNFIVTEDWGIKAYDMGIMLNNGLDNAVEAIERMRESQPEKEAYIMVKSYVRGGMVFIEIENNFDSYLQFEEGNHLPLSRKEGDAHGIGLYNIRNCARKYSGEVDCIIDGDKFILSIMLRGGNKVWTM